MKISLGCGGFFSICLFISSTLAISPYAGNYYNRPNLKQERDANVGNIGNQRRGFWCNYLVKRNRSCIVTKLDRVVEKYHYLCNGIYSTTGYCIGYRTKFVTRYAQEYRIQPVMIKDCCPGFSGKSCDKECFNCTVIDKMQKTIKKLENDQRVLAQIQLQLQTASADVSEGGLPGPRGDVGPKGEPGPSGPIGPRGPAGEPGLLGVKGEVGPMGSKGEKGQRGERGETGRAGPPGLPLIQLMPTNTSPRLQQQIGLNAGDVIMGAKGTKGEKGTRGLPGIKGDRGSPGISIRGPVGPIGKIGPTGPQGQPGLSIKGDKGNSGSRGGQGEKGERGEKGDLQIVNGPPGEQGPEGPKGNLGNEGPKGDKGETGYPGERGPAGIPGLPASGLNELRDELARLKARVTDLEKNRCNCPTQRGLDPPDTSIFEINKK